MNVLAHRALPWNALEAGQWAAALPLILGLAAMYVPTMTGMAAGAWQEDAYAHGPLVLAVSLWLFWSGTTKVLADDDFVPEPAMIAGGALLAIGLAAYVVGRSQSLVYLDAGSIPLVAAGAVLAWGGIPLVRRLWFPLFFLLFLVPLPTVIIDSMTAPLKQWISVLAEWLLYQGGYPIARNGVVLSIDRYHLFVADACSGLNSIYALCATGFFYLYAVGRMNPWRRGLILAAVLPIAFFANLVRVIALVLVTYHFGDETAQGFVHAFGGMLLFFVALALFFILDAVAARIPFFADREEDPA